MTLEIIGAGFGRTGTMSLKEALESLGFAPCHHMISVFEQPERLAAWTEARRRRERGEPIDWADVLGGFRATVDWPGCAFWRELVVAYPEAKVLLSVRDSARWYESARATIYRMTTPESEEQRRAMLAALPPELAEHMRAAGPFIDELIWQGTFGGRFSDRDNAIRVFEAHNAAVIAAVPPTRLLVYEVNDGWEPLCRFLGVDVPADRPFPHVNDAETFRTMQADPAAFRRRLAEIGRR
jgi:hypothetical protein